MLLKNYNIPSWLKLREGHLFLALLVPGKYKAKNMDVYMAPMIEELETLWLGIKVFDISRTLHVKDKATIRAIMMSTMYDIEL